MFVPLFLIHPMTGSKSTYGRSGAFSAKSSVGSAVFRAGQAGVRRAAITKGLRMMNRQLAMAATTGKNFVEKKSVDTAIGATPGTTGTFWLLNGLQEGASVYQRVGRRVRMKSLHFLARLSINGTDRPQFQDDLIRIIVVYDRQPNGAAPVMADLLLDYSQSGATTTDAMSGLNTNNADRFRVLADIRLPLIDTSSNATAVPVEPVTASAICQDLELNINRFINLQGLEAHYKASTGAVGDLASGALFAFACNNNATTVCPYTLNARARLRYYDA